VTGTPKDEEAMISRFFKKKPAPAKKAAPEKPKIAEKELPPEKPKAKAEPTRILTAEGWKRMMMRKSKKQV